MKRLEELSSVESDELAVKILTTLAECWADQNGQKIESIRVYKKDEKPNSSNVPIALAGQ